MIFDESQSSGLFVFLVAVTALFMGAANPYERYCPKKLKGLILSKNNLPVYPSHAKDVSPYWEDETFI